MTQAIHVDGLRKHINVGFWGKRKDLLFDVSFSVPAGVVFGFVGPNGAGKSTTIKTIIGAAKPSAGKVSVLGGSAHSAHVRKRIGYLPELPQLPLTLTPDEILSLHGSLIGLDRTTTRARANKLLDRVALTHRRRDRVGGFSKGMQQRLAVAVALLGEPELVILDEPMSGLDPLGRRMVRELIHEQHARGATVFFSSHVLSDVEALSTDVAILNRGRVVATGALREILDRRTAKTEISLRADNPDVAAIQKIGTLTTRGEVMVVEINAGLSLTAALTQAASAGFEVVAVETHRPSLEDQVVALIAQQSGDGGTASNTERT